MLAAGDLKVWAPAHGPRQVFFNVTVKLIYDIDSAKETFSSIFKVSTQWMLSAAERDQWMKGADKFEAQWKPPDVESPNALDMKVETSRVEVTRIGNMLMGGCTQNVQGTFLEVMELHNFPFDSQELSIKLVFPDSDEYFHLQPAVDSDACVRMTQDLKLLPEYVFSHPIAELSFVDHQALQEDFSLKAVRHPTLVLYFKSSRAWMSYINKVVLMLALVSSAVMFAFMIPRADLSDRLAHVTTLFLTAVAFQFTVSSSLPPVDYMTLIDKYIMGINVFMLCAMGMMAWTSFLEKQGEEAWPEETVASLDLNAMRLAGGMWLGIHLLFVLRGGYCVRFVERPKLLSYTKDGTSGAELVAATKYSLHEGRSRVFVGDRFVYNTLTKTSEDLTFWTGMWYSMDFYGPHGIEYVFVSVMRDDSGAFQLMARKITGDANVPGGHVTWQTTGGIPSVGGKGVACKVQVRADVNDADAFEWIEDLTMSAPTINLLDAGQGKFQRQVPLEDNHLNSNIPAEGLITPSTPLLE